ncbi:zinc protease, partial [Candidatus Endoriftia persephone str. Guaymas]|nr:zinc protease [Candidatus Endoriftia persephone str. Guaymas]
RERQATLASLLADEQSPGAIGKKALYRLVFGDHPYAHPVEGSQASVKALTRADLLATYRRLYVARNAVVAIVGAVDRAQA